MTYYDDIESSEYNSKPVELYLFSCQETNWRYTSAATNQTYGGYTYTSLPISRSSFKSSTESINSDLTIEIDPSAGVLSQYVSTVPYDIVSVQIRRVFTDASIVYGEDVSRLVWQGRITDVHFKGLGFTEISCESIFSALRRQTLRRCWQKACPHALYSQGYGECLLNKDDFAVSDVISTNSALTITVDSSYTDGYFQGGYFVINHPSRTFKRYIRSQTGNTLIIDSPILDYNVIGYTAIMYPGCDHSLDTCRSKFNNTANYGGHPWIPDENPMAGSLVF